MENKPIKIEFAPGCFDNFEGTQEELDELISEIKQMVENGEFLENSKPLDFDELAEEEGDEIVDLLFDQLNQQENRKLQ
jgi:NTP pyrophosphatase (non-canonical NTP hydrolase)